MAVWRPLKRTARNRALSFSRRSVALAMLWLSTGCEYAPPRHVLGRVLETSGENVLVAESSHAIRGRIALGEGTLISPGEKIQTGDNARVLISLLPGVILQVNANTVVAIDRLLLTKSGEITAFVMDSREGQIQLFSGSCYCIIAETYVPTNLQITTPAGVVNATQKSSFYLRATTDTVRLFNCEGEVSIRRKPQDTASPVPQGILGDWSVATGAVVSEFRTLDGDSEAVELSKNTAAVEAYAVRFIGKTINTGFGWQNP